MNHEIKFKKILLLFFSAIFLVFSVFLYQYLYSSTKNNFKTIEKNHPEQSMQPVENLIPKKTESLSVYEDRELKISFQHPSSWEINKDGEYITFKLNGNLFGTMDLTSKESFKKSFENCLIEKDYGTCEHTHYGMNYAAFLKQYDVVNILMKNDMPENIDAEKYPDFEIGCSAIGGHNVIKNIINRNLNLNVVRTIGFCGYDAHFGNYFYFATFLSKNKMFMIKFDIFPGDTELYEWMDANFTNNYTSLDVFEEKFHLSFLNDTIAEPIKNQIEIYDNLIKSLKIVQ